MRGSGSEKKYQPAAYKIGNFFVGVFPLAQPCSPGSPTDAGTSFMEELGVILFGASLDLQEHDSRTPPAQHTSTPYICMKAPLQPSQISL
jgi:hypothetical protein